MKKLLKIAGYGAAGLVLLVVIIMGVGAMVPANHVASASATYKPPPEQVWAAITAGS